MKMYIKVTFLTILCIVGTTRSSEREISNDVFKEMMKWLNSPQEKSNDDLQKQEQVSHVTKVETDPEQSRTHLNEELEGDYSEHNVKTEEYEGGGGRSDKGKKSNVVSTFRKGVKGKHKKDSDVDQHSKKGKKYHKNNHKKHGSKSDDVASKGLKGHLLRSEGHRKNGRKEDGYKNIWHKEESGRERKFIDNAEEKKFSAKHDHMKAFQNAALKGAFKTNSEEDLHLRDNHGKKLFKKEEGSFDMFLKEKDSHGRRKDYGRKKKFGRKGAHEEVFKISKGNGRKGSNIRMGSHSNREPVQIKVIKRRNLNSNSDNDIEESVQTSVSTTLPLASVLQEAGYGHRLLELPNKNITSQSATLSNINEIDDSFPEGKVITHKNRLKEKFLRQHQKHKNSLPKVSPKRRKSLRNINSKGRDTTSTVNPTESKRKNNRRNRNSRKRVKNLRRKIPIGNRRLKKLPNNINQSVTTNKTPENITKLIPIKEIQNNLEKKDLKMIPKNTSPISIFVLKDPVQIKSPKITKGKYAGHKKHFTPKLPKKLKDTEREENNEVEPESESQHESAKKPIIIKEPFITISEYKKPSEQPKITHHFNLVTIRPTSVRKSSPRETPTEQPEKTDQSRLVVIKPLEKEKSQQISVVSNESLKPSSSHGGHHKHNKPKKYAKFESFDEGHHKKKSKKIEKGGHEEHGYKGKTLKDHGKSHKSKFIDKAKKKAKGHNFKKQHEGHYDKGKKASKGHTHGKKSHSHKGHSDKGFKNVHHKKEYAVKKNYYEDEENKKSHKIFDDFDAYFEKKRKENIEALNSHANKRYKVKKNEGYHHDNSFHDSKKENKKHYHDDDHSDHFHHNDYNSHKDDKHGHHYHKDYSPHQGHNAVGSKHYNYYDYYE